MNEEIIDTRPPEPGDENLVAAFHDEIVKQSSRLDDLAKDMLKLEMGVPGIYAVALNLMAGKTATMTAGWLVHIFIFWLLAAGLTFLAIFPRRYNVLIDVVRRVDPWKKSGEKLTIEEYFRTSAEYKYKLLVIAAVSFFLGTILAVISIFSVKPV